MPKTTPVFLCQKVGGEWRVEECSAEICRAHSDSYVVRLKGGQYSGQLQYVATAQNSTFLAAVTRELAIANLKLHLEAAQKRYLEQAAEAAEDILKVSSL